MGGFRLLAKRAPILGGSFALWGGIFSLTDCAFTLIRNTESPWNQIAAGFITGGVLAIRGRDWLMPAGPRVALRNAVFGGLILVCIQVIEVTMRVRRNRRRDKLNNRRSSLYNRGKTLAKSGQTFSLTRVKSWSLGCEVLLMFIAYYLRILNS
jgi:hypothetical protein